MIESFEYRKNNFPNISILGFKNKKKTKIAIIYANLYLKYNSVNKNFSK